MNIQLWVKYWMVGTTAFVLGFCVGVAVMILGGPG